MNRLEDKKILVVGFGAQGSAQALNLRDSGFEVAIALKESSIKYQSDTYQAARNANFEVTSIAEGARDAFLVINLTPERAHRESTRELMEYMQEGSFLGFSHGFSMTVGLDIKSGIEPILCAPKGPGNELRRAFLESRGLPAILASSSKSGMEVARAWATGIGSHRSLLVESSFESECISDLFGEQVLLCGLLQSSIMALDGIVDPDILQYGFSALLSKSIPTTLSAVTFGHESFVRHYEKDLRAILEPIYQMHMAQILNGEFYRSVLDDWDRDDAWLKSKRAKYSLNLPTETRVIRKNRFKRAFNRDAAILALILKVGAELCFEIMQKSGIDSKSAYIESLYELPLLANLISHGNLDHMNSVISDMAEFGNYLFCDRSVSVMREFFTQMSFDLEPFEFELDEVANLLR